MTKAHELRAKCLEIAIALTKADHSCLVADAQGNVSLAEPLSSAYKAVLTLLTDKKHLKEESRHPEKTGLHGG